MAYPDLSNYQGTVDPAAFRARLEQAGVPVAGATSAGSVSYGMQAPAMLPSTPAQTVVQQQRAPVQNVQPVQPQTNPNQVNVDAQNYINKLIDMQKQARLSDLAKSRDSALSNLNQEKATIQPMYYDKRNQVAAGAQQQARNFAEYMAARGGATSGTAAQATLMNNVATQGNLGALGRQEAQAYTDIARRTTDTNNAYQSDVTSAGTGAEADRMKLLLQDFYNAQQRGDTQAQQAIQNAMQQQQLDLNKSFGIADRTGSLQDPQTALAIQQMKANSAKWFNASPAQQANLAAENQRLGASIGATQDAQGNWIMPQGQQTIAKQQLDFNQQQAAMKQSVDIADSLTKMFGKPITPTNDPMMMYAQVAGLSTLDAQKLAADAQNTSFDQAIKLALTNNTITQTQANILNQARQTDISSANSAANIANMKADNARQDNALKLTNDQRKFAGEVAGELGQATSRQDVIDFFNKNAAEITSQLGSTAAEKMKSDALAQYDTTKTDAAKASLHNKAISAAQNDFRWKMGTPAQKAALIKEYEGYFQ